MITTANPLQTRVEQDLLGSQEIPHSAYWGIHSSCARQNFPIADRNHCVEGIEANTALLARRVAESVTVVTALNPITGYDNSARVGKYASALGGTIADAAQALGVLPASSVPAPLMPEKLTQPAPRRDADADADAQAV